MTNYQKLKEENENLKFKIQILQIYIIILCSIIIVLKGKIFYKAEMDIKQETFLGYLFFGWN